ncbi:hypothetical protein [Rhizobium sp. CCGE 510]|uniref:hypothetical protein n=1 Tax=Rhizobium sp. CCGE 510 TaxID=1132836 RepID=UPI0009D91F59|nr:hypothetical protein [Rhizobium sp. CCGE 510]
MSKNDMPPRVTPPILPDRLRKDGWWLTETCGTQGPPSQAGSAVMLVMIEKPHLREEQQWTQQIS